MKGLVLILCFMKKSLLKKKPLREACEILLGNWKLSPNGDCRRTDTTTILFSGDR